MLKNKNLSKLVCCVAALAAFSSSAFADDLDNAFNKLVSGREYLKDFYNNPEATTTTKIVNAFLGKASGKHHRSDLLSAALQAAAIRKNNADDSDTAIYAQTIAWESLESLLTGYIYAGNKDLLNAIRAQYPDTSLAGEETRKMPKEEVNEFPLDSQKKITYARLYFLQGIKDVLNYISEDSTGKVRAVSSDYTSIPYYVKFDNESKSAQGRLPHERFDDPNFGGAGVVDGQASQTVGYLYGTALDRYGMAASSYAEQLWRAADGVEKHLPADKKEKMLNYAADLLKDNIHSQFLAVLPLAAQLTDGDGEFQKAKLPQVRVTVSDAQMLRSRIVNRERPLQTAEVEGWSTEAINEQAKIFAKKYQEAYSKYTSPDGVKARLEKLEQSEVLTSNDQEQVRKEYRNQLKKITGIDPNDARYGGLNTPDGRAAYLSAVEDKYGQFLSSRDSSGLGLLESSSMYISALQYIRAAQNIEEQKAKVDSYVQKVRVELERNHEISSTVKVYEYTMAAIDLAIEIASSISFEETVTVGPWSTGVSSTWKVDTGRIAAAAYVQAKDIAKMNENLEINAINSEATVKNLFIEQSLAASQLESLSTTVQIQAAELLGYLDQAKQLVDDYVFHQDITKDLWYNDPTLTGKLETVEEEYRSLVQDARIELYKLARMMEYAWCENFSNPVKDSNGSVLGNTLDNAAYDGFTEASSVFSCANHEKVLHFYNALQKWDTMLRRSNFRNTGVESENGYEVNQAAGAPISLRKDILKYVDYQFDKESNQYVTDPNIRRQSIQKFKAYLQSLADTDPVNVAAGAIKQLRIEFPFVYGQNVVVDGQSDPKVLVRRSLKRFGWKDDDGVTTYVTSDQYWNHRITEMEIKIVGRNIYAGSGNYTDVTMELFGNTERIGYCIDSIYTGKHTSTFFNIPLYQYDISNRQAGGALFGGIFPAALESDTYPKKVNEWPLFCDKVILILSNENDPTLRIDKIEDIEFKLKMKVGVPDPFEFPNL